MGRNKGGKAWYNWLALAMVIITVAVMAYNVVVKAPQAKGMERRLEQELGLITPYPQAAPVTSQNSSKDSQALVTRTYNTSAGYPELRAYYDAELPRHGWKFVAEKSVSNWGKDRGGKTAHYCKGDWSADVEYIGRNEDGSADYALSLSWGLEACGDER
jgi:hypothetical protein